MIHVKLWVDGIFPWLYVGLPEGGYLPNRPTAPYTNIAGSFAWRFVFSAHCHFHSFRITSLDFMMEKHTYKFRTHTPPHCPPFSMFFFPLSIQYVFLFMFFLLEFRTPPKKNSQNTQNSRTCTWLCRPRSNCPSHKAANGYIRRSGAEEIGSTPKKGGKKTGEQRSKPWHDIPLFHFYWLVHRDPYIGFLNFLYNWHHPLIYSKSTTRANWSLFMMRRSCKNSSHEKPVGYIQSNCESQTFQPTFSNWGNVL